VKDNVTAIVFPDDSVDSESFSDANGRFHESILPGIATSTAKARKTIKTKPTTQTTRNRTTAVSVHLQSVGLQTDYVISRIPLLSVASEGPKTVGR
jgi:hypothetical protein